MSQSTRRNAESISRAESCAAALDARSLAGTSSAVLSGRSIACDAKRDYSPVTNVDERRFELGRPKRKQINTKRLHRIDRPDVFK
jgi:hypothetical protein